jgi:hypothetical protein
VSYRLYKDSNLISTGYRTILGTPPIAILPGAIPSLSSLN